MAESQRDEDTKAGDELPRRLLKTPPDPKVKGRLLKAKPVTKVVK